MTEQSPTKDASAVPRIQDGATPLYRQIAGLMRRRMRSGQWPVGMQLPTLELLTEQFGVARVTVRQAMDLLEAEKMIWRRQGKGTFVAERAADHHWLSAATRWEDLVKLIAGTESVTLDSFDSPHNPPLAEGTRFAAGYRFLKKAHSYEGTPHLLLEIYLDASVYRRAPEKFETQPVIPILNSLLKQKIGHAVQTLTVGAADPEVARHLSVSVGAPVIEVQRTIQHNDGTVVYFGHLTYRSDSFRMDVQLR